MAQQNPPKRVLVVDDNHEAADVLAEMLELCGYRCMPVYGGEAALDAANVFRPDVIILDLGMPGMDGFVVADVLRKQPQFAHTRIVAFTAWGDAPTRQRTQAAGFDTHVVKPAALNTILEACAC